MAGYATSTGNRTTNDGTWTYTFDDAGNEIKKSKGAAAETWNYRYDNRNQLIAAEQHATDGGTLLAKVQYQYDALGDRIERDEDADGNGTYETVERFAYDGWKVHQDAGGGQAGFIGQENFDVWADLNGSNALTTRRLFGDAIDQIVARINSGGTSAWYYQDRLGSVRNLVDATGTLQETLTYDGFGNILTDSNPTFGDRYKYTAREWDSLTNLQGNRARFFDPRVGKWTTNDAAGFAAGDVNLSRYVDNQVDRFSDPSGLEDFKLAIENSAKKLIVYRDKWGKFTWPIKWKVSSADVDDKKIRGVIVQKIEISWQISKLSSGHKPVDFVPDFASKIVYKYWEFWRVSPKTKQSEGPVIHPTITVAASSAVGKVFGEGFNYNDIFGMTYKDMYGSDGPPQGFTTKGSLTIKGEAVFYQNLTIADFGPSGLDYKLSNDSHDYPTGAKGLWTVPACSREKHDDWFIKDDIFEILGKREKTPLGKPMAASNKVEHMIRVKWDPANNGGETVVDARKPQ